MNNSKLSRSLLALGKEELDKFDKFVHSPYFKCRNDTIRFFEYIKPFLLGQNGSQFPPPEFIFNKVYPNSPFNDLQFRTLKKFLLKYLYRFLEYEQFSKAHAAESYYLLEALAEKELIQDFHHELKRKRKIINGSNQKDSLHFLRKFEIEDIALSFSYYHKSRWEKKDIIGVADHLTHHFLAEKLKYACSTINMGHVFEGEHQIPLLQEIIKYCQSELSNLPIVVQIFYHLYLLHVQPEGEEHYLKLKRLSNESFNTLPIDEWQNIYFSLINWGNHQYRKGKSGYLEEMLSIYKEMLNKKVMENLHANLAHHYKNITTLGLRLGEIKWTEEFIHSFKDHLPEEGKENNFRFNLANLRVSQGKYREALVLMREESFIDPFYRMGYEILLMKIYYECNEIEPLLALCDSFRLYVRRKKELTQRQQQAYINFAKLTRKLIKNKLNFRYKQLDLSAQIEACDPLIERGWLLDKQRMLIDQFVRK